MDYTKVYTKLYELGYHIKEKTNIGEKLAESLMKKYDFKSILDVGCSQGLAVKKYQESGIDSYGIDVSERAIKESKKLKIRNCQVASVLELPCNDNTFDAIVSTDVLEHLEPNDIKKALNEINRSASKYLFLQIAKSKEGRTDWIDLLKEKHPELVEGINNLHLSVFQPKQWVEWVESFGKFKLLEKNGKLLVFKVKNDK